jgi:hypothetical protein
MQFMERERKNPLMGVRGFDLLLRPTCSIKDFSRLIIEDLFEGNHLVLTEEDKYLLSAESMVRLNVIEKDIVFEKLISLSLSLSLSLSGSL